MYQSLCTMLSTLIFDLNGVKQRHGRNLPNLEIFKNYPAKSRGISSDT